VENHVSGIVDGAALAPPAQPLLAGLPNVAARFLPKPVRSAAQLGHPFAIPPVGDHLQIHRNGGVALPVQGAVYQYVPDCGLRKSLIAC